MHEMDAAKVPDIIYLDEIIISEQGAFVNT